MGKHGLGMLTPKDTLWSQHTCVDASVVLGDFTSQEWAKSWSLSSISMCFSNERMCRVPIRTGWVHMCVTGAHVCVCTHEPVEGSSSTAPHLLFRSSISHWTWCSAFRLDKAAMPVCLGFELQPSHFHSKHATHWAISPAPRCLFFFLMEAKRFKLFF